MRPADPKTSASAPAVTVTARHLLILTSIAAAWGASFLFIRIAAPALGPTRLIEVRMALAGLVLLGYALATRRRPSLAGRSWQWLVIGALWALPFVLIAIAELQLTASLAAVLNATTPLFAALAAAVWLRDRLTAAKSAGLLVGLLGVLVVVGWSPLAPSLPVVWSAGASLLAAAVYGIAGAYGARAFQGIASLQIATGQLLAGALLLLPTVLVSIPAPTNRPVTAAVVLAAAGLALPCTAWAFVLFFRLVAELGPTSALTVTFLVPVFGIVWGAVFLGEPVSWSLVGGLAIVLAGITLVTGWRPQRARARSAR
jgi:drug/metabolite transporter (DMT)-like permease